MMQQRSPQRMRRPGLTAGILLGATCLVAYFESTLAQQAGQVTIDAARCRELASPDERLACFEAEVDGAITGERNQRESPPPAPASAGSQPSTPTADVRSPRQLGSAAEADHEWIGRIASLTTRAPNRYVITLDNGQVWEQRVAERYLLRVGQRVRIYGSRWGNSQRLEADGLNGFIQVQRVL